MTKKPEESLKVTMTVEISWKRIQDLLCCALEGGSNYWYLITDFHKPKSMPVRTDDKQVFRHLDYPVNPGGSLIFGLKDEELGDMEERWTLDRKTLQTGLEIFSKEHPKHFANFQQENEDADTGDVFLQVCLFGKVVYG
jgi:hypothetical protein